MLLYNPVNCINQRMSKVIHCGVLLNGAYEQFLSMCSSIALVAILSPFPHPQYKISLPLFSLYFFIPTFSISSSCPCRLHLHSQFPSTSDPDTIKLHLLHLHMRKCDSTHLSVWRVHSSIPSSSAHMTCEMFLTLMSTMWEWFCFIFQEKG